MRAGPRTTFVCPECSAPFARWDSEIESATPTCGIDCRSARRRRLNSLNAARLDGLRTCSTCDAERPATSAFFEPYRDRRRKHILKGRCRGCQSTRETRDEAARRVPTPVAPARPVCAVVPYSEDFEDRPIGVGVMGSAA